MSRLTIEKFISNWAEIFVEKDVKGFLRASFDDQLRMIAQANRLLYKSMENKSGRWCMSVLLENIADNKPCLYRVSETFGKHLFETADLKIPMTLLPKAANGRETFYVQFPKSIGFEYSGKKYNSMIIDYGDLDKLTSETAKGYIAYRFFSIDPTGEDIPSVIFVTPKNADMDIIEQVKTIAHGKISIPQEILEYCFKILLYIHSGEPDLTPEHVHRYQPTNKEKYIRNLKNHCPFPVYSLGYDFHGRKYSMDSGPRRGFFRWQRHGPGNSLVKLIWIDATTVNYKTDDTP